MFCKKSVLRNFTKFTGKHLCQSPFFIKLHADVCNFIKKETLPQVFSYEFCEICKNTFPYRAPPVVVLFAHFTESSFSLSQNSRLNPKILYNNNNLMIFKSIFSNTTVSYLFRVNYGNTRKKRRFGFFLANFEHILHLFLVLCFCCLMTLSRYLLAGNDGIQLFAGVL